MSKREPDVYMNEWDKKAAAWSRELIKQGYLEGVVDESDIRKLSATDLMGYRHCHFFSGILGWPYALKLAGWPSSINTFTGSCPCQSFSTAGKRKGFADERHLWPDWFKLIKECRPTVIFGEQVASKDALPWLDLVFDDLEGEGYTCGAADLCSAGIGAPHIRQRLYWVAYSASDGLCERGTTKGIKVQGKCTEREGEHSQSRISGELPRRLEGLGSIGGMANTNGGNTSTERQQCSGEQRQQQEDSGTCGMGNSTSSTSRRNTGRILGTQTTSDSERCEHGSNHIGFGDAGSGVGLSSSLSDNNFWRDADWLYCRDGKWRPVEPGTFPLAHGVSQRVGLLRGYGNAITPQVAAEFVMAFMETMGIDHDYGNALLPCDG